MSLTLLSELARFLTALEQVQEELLALFAEKRRALDTFQAEEIVRLAEREAEPARRLQALVSLRSDLLRRATAAGFASNSLLELSGVIGKHVGDARVRAAIESLRARILHAQQRTAELQRESWVHWIVSHRCYNHYTELREMIADGGTLAPTYGDKPSTKTGGGAFLDAAA